MKLASLHIHPVKGCRAITSDRSDFDSRGLLHDRRMMLTDENGDFLTQREMPALVRLQVAVDGDAFVLTFEDKGSLRIDRSCFSRRETVRVWRSHVACMVSNGSVNETLEDWFGRIVQLAWQDDNATRHTSTTWAGEGVEVSLADGYPVLITNTASLDALNAAICETAQDAGAGVPMSRFRPSLVIECDMPWAEDGWKRIQVGEAVFDLVKPCDRCVVSTHDQTSGAVQGNEPIATLMRIRRSAHPELSGVLFGWNAVPISGKTVQAGDPVTILEKRQEGWPLRANAFR